MAGLPLVVLWIVGVVVSLGVPIVIVYMAIHFAHKWW